MSSGLPTAWYAPYRLPVAPALVNACHAAVQAALPATPFCYLGVLGTHPDHAGRRWGHFAPLYGLAARADRHSDHNLQRPPLRAPGEVRDRSARCALQTDHGPMLTGSRTSFV